MSHPVRRLRVAIVNQPWNACPPIEGGSIAIWIDEVARRLAPDCKVTVYAKKTPSQPAEEIAHGVRWRRFSIAADLQVPRLLRHLPGQRGRWERMFASPLYYPFFARRVARDLRRHPVDVVHVHNLSQMVPVLRRACPRARLVLHMHCDWLVQIDGRTAARRLAACDAVAGCSEHVAGAVARRFEAWPGQCLAIANGVDVEWFRPATEGLAGAPPRILFVGRLSPEKGVHVLIDAFARLAATHPSAELELVGPDGVAPRAFLVDRSEDPRVRALARFYGDGASYRETCQALVPAALAARVRFVGPARQHALRAHYQAADVLVNPSLSEAFGMSLVEAMACGVPVVGARAGGMPEIVADGETGFLVEPDDAAALADRLARLLADRSLRARLGLMARERAVAHYAWDRVAAATLAAYEARPLGQPAGATL